MAGIIVGIVVTAADLSGTGVKVESFRFMKNVRCVSKHHGLDFRSPVVSLARNLLDRSDYKITVGDTQKSYTGVSITSKRETESKAEEIISLEREARKKAIEDLVSKVEKAPGLYITDTGEGEAHNWYLHDKKTVEESYIIIRVNAAGIIFSTDGGNHYNGVSWDGDAILKKIYAIGIDANHINAGELNAAIVKIKNLHMQDISDDKGVTLDATLNGITADVSAKYKELDGKISNNSASIKLLPDSITSTVKTTYIDPLTTRITDAEASIKQTTDSIESKVSKGDIISTINQSAESVVINASKISLEGAVTFSALDSSLQSTVQGAKTANETIESWSLNGDRTIIDGGKIAARSITADKIAIGDFTNYATVTENDASTLLTDQAIMTDPYWGYWIEKTDRTTGLRYLFVSQLCINLFNANDILKFDFDVWCSAAQKVWYGIWFFDENGTYVTGVWNAEDVEAIENFKSISGKVEVPTISADIKYYRIGLEFEKYDLDSRNCIRKARVTKVSGYFQIGEGFIDSAGPFKIGCMQSVGELNDDVEFKHAIFVDYGIELLAGNDGATPYIDFHTEASSHDKAAYDYTARLQNTQKSWITFYGLSDGKNTPAGCTVQSAQFRGTLVNDSDRRLKQDIVDLNIDEVLNEISKYRPVSYKYINGVDDNVHHGLIAQEAQEIAQWGLVDDRGEYLAINYIDLISDLIKTTQYSLKEIEKLKTIIDN